MNKPSLVLCACGCGELFVPFDDRGRPRKYIYGHYSRIQPTQQEDVPCSNCGKPVRRAQWQQKRVANTFCDQTCFGEYSKKHGITKGENNGHYNTVTVPCAGCGAPISKPHSLVYRRNNRVYCPNCRSPKLVNGKPVTWEDYPLEFTKKLRHVIRMRDKYICQECGATQGEGKAFPIHHIDYDKFNCDQMNLITLCHSCHSRTQFARTQCTKRLATLMRARFP